MPTATPERPTEEKAKATPVPKEPTSAKPKAEPKSDRIVQMEKLLEGIHRMKKRAKIIAAIIKEAKEADKDYSTWQDAHLEATELAQQIATRVAESNATLVEEAKELSRSMKEDMSILDECTDFEIKEMIAKKRSPRQLRLFVFNPETNEEEAHMPVPHYDWISIPPVEEVIPELKKQAKASKAVKNLCPDEKGQGGPCIYDKTGLAAEKRCKFCRRLKSAKAKVPRTLTKTQEKAFKKAIAEGERSVKEAKEQAKEERKLKAKKKVQKAQN